MSAPFRTLLLIVGASAGLACASDESLAPTPQAKEPRVFTTLSLRPVSPSLYPGETLSLDAFAKDQRGYQMVPEAIVYSSSDPAVATVSDSGIVTAATVGTAIISATATIGASSRTGAILVTVFEPHNPYTPYGVLLVFGHRGWEPPVVDVEAGALVEWRGSPSNDLWLLDANYGVLERLDMTSGVAKWTLDAPGTYRYCSGACWDPPDFGVIYVR
ncbi:hypothetical protein BH23GEM2_BH23GEM2_20510 [soil metagenome]